MAIVLMLCVLFWLALRVLPHGLWVALPLLFLASCATLSRDVAKAALVTVKGIGATAEALDAADAIVQPACPNRQCLDDWRVKRDAAHKSLTIALDSVDALTKAVRQ